MATLESIKVFIASPGDLSDERRLFPDIIQSVNEIKAHTAGFHFVAVGWEDTLPDFGRPQAIINKDVEGSDIFVMLLWRRWGTPSGEFSSGTEEEFSIACRRYKSTGDPHLLLYFRSVPEAMMADPGHQLQKVIDFRTRIEVERSCLYKGYESLDQWRDLLTKHLCLWLDRKKLGADFGAAPSQGSFQISDESDQRIIHLQKQLQEVTAKWESTQAKLRVEAVEKALEAMASAKQGKLTRAEEMFAKSLDLYEEPEVLNTFGRFLFQTGSMNRAHEKYQRLLTWRNKTMILRCER